MKSYASILVIFSLASFLAIPIAGLDMEIRTINPDDLLVGSFRLSQSNTEVADNLVVPQNIIVMGAYGRAVFIDQTTQRILWKSSFLFTSVPDHQIVDFVTLTNSGDGIPLALLKSDNGKDLVCYNAALGMEKWRLDQSSDPIISDLRLYDQSGQKMAYAITTSGAVLEIRVSDGATRSGRIPNEQFNKNIKSVQLFVKDAILARADNGMSWLLDRHSLQPTGFLDTASATDRTFLGSDTLLVPGFVLQFVPNEKTVDVRVFTIAADRTLKESLEAKLSIQGKLTAAPIEFGVLQIAFMTETGKEQTIHVYRINSSDPSKALQLQKRIKLLEKNRMEKPVLIPKVNKETIGDFFVINENGILEIELIEGILADVDITFGSQKAEGKINFLSAKTVLESGKVGLATGVVFSSSLQVSADTASFYLIARLTMKQGESTVLLHFYDLIQAYSRIGEMSVIDNGLSFLTDPAVRYLVEGTRLYFCVDDGRFGSFEIEGINYKKLRFSSMVFSEFPSAIVDAGQNGILVLTKKEIFAFNDETLTMDRRVLRVLESGVSYQPYIALCEDYLFLVDTQMRLRSLKLTGAKDASDDFQEEALPRDLFNLGDSISGVSAVKVGSIITIAVAGSYGVSSYYLETESLDRNQLTESWSFRFPDAGMSIGSINMVGSSVEGKSAEELIVVDKTGMTAVVLDPLGTRNGNQGLVSAYWEDATSGSDVIKSFKLSTETIGGITGNNLYFFVPTQRGLDFYNRNSGMRVNSFATDGAIAGDQLYLSSNDTLIFVDISGVLYLAQMDLLEPRLLDRYFTGGSFRISPVSVKRGNEEFILVQSSDDEILIFDSNQRILR